MSDKPAPAVLVVEDDAAIRRIVVRILTGGGFRTSATGDATEGLSLVREGQGEFELAIIDMMMPGMSGLDLGSELSREYPELKILYISGFIDSIAANVLSRRSPEQVLLKPFGGQALLNRVGLLLGKVARRQPGRFSESSRPQTREGATG